jgi:hypothetical protein
MAITPCFDPTTGASGGASPSGGAEPVQPPAATSQSVAAGGAYATVTFGAFTDPDGVIANYSASQVNANGSTTWAGTGLGAYTASGAADGDAGTLYLNALDGDGDIVATAVHSYRRASPPGSAAWVDLQDYDFTDVVTQSQVTSGTVTLAFASSADTIDLTVSAYAGNTGGVTPTSGSGLVYGGGGAAGTMTAAYDWVSELASTWNRAYALGAPIAVHFVLTGVSYPGTADDGIFMGLSTTTAHNSGSRGWYLRRDAVATDEDRRVRVNTSNSTIIDTPAIKSSRVLTVILLAGTVVEVMDTSGTTPPVPAIGGATTYSVGCSSLSTLAAQPTFVTTAYAYLSLIEQASFTVTRMLVQRYQ